LRIVASDGAITALEFAGQPPPSASPHSSVTKAQATSSARDVGERGDDDPLLREAARQLRGYFDHEVKDFDLPLAPRGTPFQQRVWEQLQRIGYGETTSYGEIAGRLGLTSGASRAVGAANGRNPIAIVIPCHRVVGSTGTLTGYAGGVERKRALLDHEQDPLFL
jgi:methylated-DNA-[protein]-cysteine S-methyltransferase